MERENTIAVVGRRPTVLALRSLALALHLFQIIASAVIKRIGNIRIVRLVRIRGFAANRHCPDRARAQIIHPRPSRTAPQTLV